MKDGYGLGHARIVARYKSLCYGVKFIFNFGMELFFIK